MKPHTLPVKRRPVQKGMFKRLSAVTANHRKQRVAATANPETDFEDGSSKISRALTIIFLIHIVAIGLIFVHQKFLDGRPAEASETARAEKLIPVATPPPRQLDLPKLAAGDKTYVVGKGDNYARIAESLGLDETRLRQANNNVEIRSGLVLKLPEPEPKRIVANEPPELTALRQPKVASPAEDQGLVDAVDVRGAPRATLVRGKNTEALPKAAPVKTTAPAKSSTASGRSYTVQSGDSIWRIANRFKVNQNALMKANGISDAKKIKPGMNLTIP